MMMNKKMIYKRYLNTVASLNKVVLQAILKNSKNGIDPELLFSIIVIEKMNRGHLSNYILEKTISFVAPSILIKSDASIGLCQIRVSAARKVSNLSDKIIVKRLMDPVYNIRTMAKLISLYKEKNIDESNPTKTILNLHITAKSNVPPNVYLNMYYELVNWSIDRKLFFKIYSKNR